MSIIYKPFFVIVVSIYVLPSTENADFDGNQYQIIERTWKRIAIELKIKTGMTEKLGKQSLCSDLKLR